MNIGHPTTSAGWLSTEFRARQAGKSPTRSLMMPRMEAAGSAALSIYWSVNDSAIRGHRLCVLGQKWHVYSVLC